MSLRTVRATALGSALLLTTATGLLSTAAPAVADGWSGYARLLDNVFMFEGYAGVANRVEISWVDGAYRVDDVVPVLAGPGCTPVTGDSTVAICRRPGPNPQPLENNRIWVGEYDESPNTVLFTVPAAVHIDGGYGADTLTVRWPAGTNRRAVIDGGSGVDTINGSSGNDTIYGGDGDDVIEAGSGDDLLKGGGGADTFFGGAGTDEVSYYGSASVWVDLDGQSRDDGERDEGDTVHVDVENLTGGWHNDWLVGNGRGNTINGGGGQDYLYGLGGVDKLYGGSYYDPDNIFGGDGDDEIYGEYGDDWLYGEAGWDKIYGGDGYDGIEGGEGWDRCWRGSGGANTTQCEEVAS